MSLFQAREWWSAYAGNDEEFDSGSLCVANIDNSSPGTDKIIVGSFHGILRIFIPQPPEFKPSDLMVEMQLPQPILQLEAGRFVSGTENIHLAVLHPRKLAVYAVNAFTGSVEHGHHYSLNLAYEHILERTSSSMTIGSFGGVKGKDFVAVLSMDGVLSFFEQEMFTFSRYLPNFLVPGPVTYIKTTDCFATCGSSGLVEAYKYQTLAVASDSRPSKEPVAKGGIGKKLTADWSTNLGELVISIKFVEFANAQPLLFILGERSLFCIRENGSIKFMKKLEFNPSTFLPYTSIKDGTVNVMIGTHTSSLLIYQDVSLIWASQLPHNPVVLKTGSFQDLNGVIVTMDEFGYLYCSYLGTDPSLFVAPSVESREINYEELDKEMKQLQKVVKEFENSSDISMLSQKREDLTLSAEVSNRAIFPVDSGNGGEGDEYFPSVNVKLKMTCESTTPIENVTLTFVAPSPLICNQPSFTFPIIGDKSADTDVSVSFSTTGESIPSSLTVTAMATYFTSSEAPRISQCEFDLPLLVICKGCAPVKQAQFKLTLDTNKNPVNMAELFPEMVDNAVIPVAAVGMQYYGGPVVTLLSSKTSQRYRLQCDTFEGLWPAAKEFIRRLEDYFAKNQEGAPFKPSFSGPLPFTEYYELIDSHFEHRKSLEQYKEVLGQRAHQFRVIQRRLLTRFKDRTPAPLANLDVLLEGTYRQLLALADAAESANRAILHSGNALACGTRLMCLLIKLWTNMPEKEYTVLQQCLSAVVEDHDDYGWEEVTDISITHLLRTCLAKSVKDQAVSVQPLKAANDTVKLKKRIALLCERLNKGARLDLSVTDNTEKTATHKVSLDPVNETAEEEDTVDGPVSSADSSLSRSSMANDGKQLPSVTGGRKGKLPSLKRDLDKTIMISTGSTEAAVVADAAARAESDRFLTNGSIEEESSS